MKNELSILKMLITDYIAFISWLTPLIFFIAYFFVSASDSTDGMFFSIIAIGSAVLGTLLIIWRIWIFRDVFENGQIADGEIIKIFFYKSRGHITFTYIYRSEKYKHKTAIQKMSFRFKYHVGDHVTIILDPQNPKRAFIRDLYVGK